MKLVLMRIEDRLLHAQVAVGWIEALSPDVVVVGDDATAVSPGQAQLLGMGLPAGVRLIVAKASEVAGILTREQSQKKKYMLIVRNPVSALQILEAGLSIETINIGGMHHAEGKTKLLPYVFVDGKDIETLKKIAARKVKLVAQDVPGNSTYDILKLLGKTKFEKD